MSRILPINLETTARVEERVFKGSLVTQLRDCLDYLEHLSEAHLKKERDRIQVRRWVNYPLRAPRNPAMPGRGAISDVR